MVTNSDQEPRPLREIPAAENRRDPSEGLEIETGFDFVVLPNGAGACGR